MNKNDDVLGSVIIPKTATLTLSQRKNARNLHLSLFKIPTRAIKSHWRTESAIITSSKNKGIIGKASGVAVTLKGWWRDVGLCPRVASPSVGTHPTTRHRCCHRRGSLRSMGQSFSMCKFNNCRHKKVAGRRGGCQLMGAPPEPSLHIGSPRHNHNSHGAHCYDPEYAKMEAWLDEHPDFVQDYFLRKATRQVVDSWLVSHATPTSTSVELASPTHNQSRAGSGATTPVRKISAHEFERGGLLKPMISTIDGQPTFLTSENQTPGVNGSSQCSAGGRGGRGTN
ncbi:hypothetical protein NQ317_015756 [Molorchus minor]|uniref:Uncharacterized protein n=1 Tax=Molorchus minor TaxID=1323400 RepID=A0ABQ9K571_9CUCU|nr:hypothetical protein NQ317_015756 [Molorchus minor]